MAPLSSANGIVLLSHTVTLMDTLLVQFGTVRYTFGTTFTLYTFTCTKVLSRSH
jgi:hypothetical protein